jgi:hypothetical protein
VNYIAFVTFPLLCFFLVLLSNLCCMPVFSYRPIEEGHHFSICFYDTVRSTVVFTCQRVKKERYSGPFTHHEDALDERRYSSYSF